MRTRKHLMNGVKVSLVNGRDLHRFVASGKAYRTWVQIHLERGELVRDILFDAGLQPPDCTVTLQQFQR